MNDNRVSASLSDADRKAVLAAINTIKQKLPFLIDICVGLNSVQPLR